MARVTFMDGIASVSGKLGDTIYRRTASGKTIAYRTPQRTYHKPTTTELNRRHRFALRTTRVSTILGDPTQRAAYEQLLKQTPSAKRLTLRKYIFQQLSATLPRPKASLPHPNS